jgi:hypothetical protein
VEQKNGAVVRQVVGYDRLEGERTYRQLSEVYQALRLYVNGFQPSMKLQAKQYDGRKVRRVYDAAKTPLQRLLLSHVLPASTEQELLRVAQVLDPLGLFHHLQDLQQALLGSTISVSPDVEGISSGALLPFCIQRCIGGPHAVSLRVWRDQGRRRWSCLVRGARARSRSSSGSHSIWPLCAARVQHEERIVKESRCPKGGTR